MLITSCLYLHTYTVMGQQCIFDNSLMSYLCFCSQDSPDLMLLLRMLSLGQGAWDMIDSQVFKEPRLVRKHQQHRFICICASSFCFHWLENRGSAVYVNIQIVTHSIVVSLEKSVFLFKPAINQTEANSFSLISTLEFLSVNKKKK